MPPRLCVVGLSHRTAPIEVREQVAFAEDTLAEALKHAVAVPGIGEVMIVSTCNRVELYAGIDEGGQVADVVRVLGELRGLSESVRAQLYTLDGPAAVRHLFRVASSLDSMVVGEPQILGQVKDAFAAAGEAGTIGPLLQRVVPRAFAVAKRVRTETEVARSAASVASAAVDLAAQIFGELAGKQVMVVGAGKMGDLAARHFKAAGVDRLMVVNRTLERAEELARRLGGVAAPMSDFDALLLKADIVLCSTGAREPVVRAAPVQRVMKQRKGRWLFFIDIAVPRDVEPEVGALENVYLYDVDALEKVVESNRAGRARAAADAEALVEAELERLWKGERVQGAVPTIKALREKFLVVARSEAERALERMKTISDKERAQVNQLAESIVNKLLHTPLTALKREAGHEGDALLAAVRALFELEAIEAAPEKSVEATPPVARSAEGKE
jgi:glutamyl-tRNA reductase